MADKTTIMKEAQKYVMKGQIDKAIAEWDKLIREAPDGNTYNIIGDLYLRKGDKKGAAEYLHKSANFFRHDGFSLKALALYKKVLNINPADTGALYALGQLSEEKGLITDSIKYYLATAESLSKEGRKDELLGIYQKIISLSPSNVVLRTKVAEIFLREGLVSDAAGQYIGIAQSYEEKDDVRKALEFYQKALEIQPSNRPAMLGIALLIEKTGDLAAAIAHFKAAVALFPDDQTLVLKYAELSLAAGQGAAAEESLLKLRAIDPGNIAVRKYLGDIYLKAGQTKKAWDEYLPVIGDMVAQGNNDNAIHHLELFRDIDPVEIGKRLVSIFTQIHDDDRLAAELVSLGDLYQEQGLEEEATDCFRNAAEVKPYDEDIQKRLRVTEPVAAPGQEPPQEKESITIITGAEKTAEEIFVETDIFSRYGLVHEAVKLLESLKLREPQNIDVHMRLKALYAETAENELAVTECLVLHELYKRKGDSELAAKELRDAVEIAPGDPRLEGRVEPPPAFEPTSYSPSVPETAAPGSTEEIEDYEDALAEADFYIRQGLMQEASKILEKMHGLFPGNTDITERLESIGQITEPYDSEAMHTGPAAGTPSGLYETETPPVPEPQKPVTEQPAAWKQEAPEFELETTRFAADDGWPSPVSPDSHTYSEDQPSESEIADLEIPVFELPEEEPLTEFGGIGHEAAVAETELQPVEEVEQKTVGVPSAPEESGPSEPPPGEAPAKEEYEDLMLTEQDLDEAQEMPDLALDDDVLEIFQEFKKGLEQELGDEDSETHYNLGIAYKEMGLIDDAIKAFQTSKNDPKRFIQSSTMLGDCYMEKGLYTLAIDVLKNITMEVTEQDESFWPVRYELAGAYEKNNNLREALDLYTAVYGWNAKFRDVSEKMSEVSARLSTQKNEPPRRGPGAGSGGDTSKTKKDRVSYL